MKHIESISQCCMLTILMALALAERTTVAGSREHAAISSSGPALAYPVSGTLEQQLAILNAPPPAPGAGWLPVWTNDSSDAFEVTSFRCDCAGVPGACGCVAENPVSFRFVAANEPIVGAAEVTYDNCGSAFYRFTFTLPPGYSAPALVGTANVDDQAVAYLNGNRISPSMAFACEPSLNCADACYGLQEFGHDRVDGLGRAALTQPTADFFAAFNPAHFVSGENELVFAVCGDASFYEPTGVEFAATLSYTPSGASCPASSAVFWKNPAGGNWSTNSNWSTASAPTLTQDAILLPLDGPYSIELTSAPTMRSLYIDSLETTVNVNSSSAIGNGYMRILNCAENHGTIALRASHPAFFARVEVVSATPMLNGPTGVIELDHAGNGTLDLDMAMRNQGTIVVDPAIDPVDIFMPTPYYADGGTIEGPGYFFEDHIYVLSAPAQPSTIVIGGGDNQLRTDNLGYVIEVRAGAMVFNAALIVRQATTNHGTIRLDSVGSESATLAVDSPNTLTNSTTGLIEAIRSNQSVAAARVVSGIIENAGRFRIAARVAITMNGTLAQQSTSALAIELAGVSPAQHSRLVMGSSSSLSLDGTLLVTPIAGFAPETGQEYEIAVSGLVSGGFDQISGPGTYTWLLRPNGNQTTSVMLRVVRPPCTADVNHDGSADLADYGSLQINFGAPGSSYEHGDLDLDEDVDLDDLAALVATLGDPCPL